MSFCDFAARLQTEKTEFGGHIGTTHYPAKSRPSLTVMRYQDFPHDMLQEQPLEAVLDLLGFVPANLGRVRQFGDLEFGVCESLNCSFLSRDGRVTSRTWTPPYEVRIFSPIAPIDLMATIYRLWSEVYPNQEPPDTDLYLGMKWTEYRREVKKLIPPPPTLWADREFLRFCLTYIERSHDWVDADYEIRFSQAPGQLLIIAKDSEVYCPARGNWVGEIVISAKALFRHLPKRFIGHVVTLQSEGDKLRIDTRVFPARWTERDAAQNNEPHSDAGAE